MTCFDDTYDMFLNICFWKFEGDFPSLQTFLAVLALGVYSLPSARSIQDLELHRPCILLENYLTLKGVHL